MDIFCTGRYNIVQLIIASVLFGCRENYVHDRPVADIGMKLFQQEPVAKELSLDEALYMLSAYKLGRSGYTNLRFDMKKRVEFPAYYRYKQPGSISADMTNNTTGYCIAAWKLYNGS